MTEIPGPERRGSDPEAPTAEALMAGMPKLVRPRLSRPPDLPRVLRGPELEARQARLDADAEAAARRAAFEVSDNSVLIRLVIEASAGSANITTSLRGDARVAIKDNENEPVAGGFTTFGDGTKLNGDVAFLGDSARIKQEVEGTAGMAEAVAFIPVKQDIFEQQSTGLFWNKSTKRVKVNEATVYISNPVTGKSEPAVAFEYVFNARLMSPTEQAQLPPYPDSSGRDGNILITRIMLPQSIAGQLKAAIIVNPGVARDIVKSLVMKNSNVSDRDWSGEGFEPQSPPYKQLPSSWRMRIIEPDENGQLRAQVIDRPLLDA